MQLVPMLSGLKDAGFSVRSDSRAATDELYEFDRSAVSAGCVLLGVDEAGRGPLAGPVVAAAVLLDSGVRIEGINDSKKVPVKRRERLFEEITASALQWATGRAQPEEIDRINILQATLVAMHRAVEKIAAPWNMLFIDGNQKIRTVSSDLQKTIIGGDAKSASIAAASIIAKVTRDRLMMEYHDSFPHYGFDVHKGYGTRLHRDRIRKFGLSPIHRRSFCSNLVLQTVLDL